MNKLLQRLLDRGRLIIHNIIESVTHPAEFAAWLQRQACRPLNLLALALFLLALLFASCKTQKNVQRDVSADTIYVGSSEHHRTFSVSDSIIESLCLDFDTLDISKHRLIMGDTIETFRLRAVKGQVASNRSQQRLAIEAKTRLDSTAYKTNSTEKSVEHTATTRVYDPPKLIYISLALCLVFIILYFKKK